ncbi:MAG: hypothetical protein HFF09_05200 [Oscillospiraceae bacterium]|nr:hypothetical protein [Oscillospiraceae bacterium]
MFSFAPISPRIQTLMKKRENANRGKVRMDGERTKIYTDYYKTHEAEPYNLKRAHCVYEWAAKKTILVEDEDIFVGNLGRTFRSAQPFVEWDARWVYDAVHSDDEVFRKAWQTPGCFAYMSDEDREIFKEASEYWMDRSIAARATATAPPSVAHLMGDGSTDFFNATYTTGSTVFGTMPQGHFSTNYKKAVEVGFGAIKKECEERMAAMDGLVFGADAKKYNFYRTTAIVCDAAILLSKRYAEECRRQAETKAADDPRKAELLKMADSLDWIMENPARNTWEAMQVVIFYQQMLISDGQQHALTLGRVDQYGGWLAKAEMEAGTLTQEDVQELADAFYLKLTDNIGVKRMGSNDLMAQMETGEGVEHSYSTCGQHFTVGGQLKDGSDATNPMTIALLQTCGRLFLCDPSVSCRIHKGTPDEVWQLAIEASKLAGGMPTLENDDVIMPALMRRGVTLEDARDYAIIGCVEPTVGGKDYPACGGDGIESFFNLVGPLVLALHDGCNPTTGYTGGLKTGCLYEYKDFEAFKQAYADQLAHYLRWHVTVTNFYELMYAEYFPSVVCSATMDGCMESGKDVLEGGAVYNTTGSTGCGIGNVADSLMAVKMAMDGRLGCTTKDLYNAISANWEGYDDLQKKVLYEMPHYGNNIEEVDELAVWSMTQFADTLNSLIGPRGNYNAGTFTMTVHISYGAATAATPDGRKKGEPLAEAISSRQGFDKNGPTAYLTSAAKLPHTKLGNGDQLNIRFSPSVVNSDQGTQKLRALISTYFAQGGMQVQFNVVATDTLHDAQENPDKYKNLIVRIAGFSAYFVEMPKAMQDDFITRTENSL